MRTLRNLEPGLDLKTLIFVVSESLQTLMQKDCQQRWNRGHCWTVLLSICFQIKEQQKRQIFDISFLGVTLPLLNMKMLKNVKVYVP